MSGADARHAAARAARESRQRLVAFLSAQTRDVAAAEDALADAFEAALEVWPLQGVPEKPEAWLLTTARRRLLDGARHRNVAEGAHGQLLSLAREAAEARAVFPDRRLELLFVCAHPAIDAAVRTPLMLQVVLGLDAARIASAFLVKPATMGQRLSRAKVKIRDAAIAFEVPGERELPTRLDAVLEAIYAAYGTGWSAVPGGTADHVALADEALELASLLARLLPDVPEVLGLEALLLFCDARRAARTLDGEYVPLSEQDPARWSRPMISRAAQLLDLAGRQRRPGRFQLEAAIQSVHAQRVETGRTDWHALALLYEGLLRVAPTVGARLGQLAALANARGPEAVWPLLEAMAPELARAHQPYWALRAELLRRLGRHDEARAAYARAIGLSADEPTRRFLLRQRESLTG